MKTSIESYDKIKNIARDLDVEEYWVYAALLCQENHLGGDDDDIGNIINYLHCYVLWEFQDSRNCDFNVVEMKRDLFIQVFHDYEPPWYWFDDPDWKKDLDHMQEVYDKRAIGESEQELDYMLRDMGVENVVFFDYTYPKNGTWHTSRYVAYTDVL